MREGVFAAHFSPIMEGVIERLARLGKSVPESVELDYDLCYGDHCHRHEKEPEDAGLMTEVMNRLAASVRRRIDWVHLPVPRARSDDAFLLSAANPQAGPAHRNLPWADPSDRRRSGNAEAYRSRIAAPANFRHRLRMRHGPASAGFHSRDSRPARRVRTTSLMRIFFVTGIGPWHAAARNSSVTASGCTPLVLPRRIFFTPKTYTFARCRPPR